MATEIDMLMDLDPLEMTSKDIDAIIAYHRNNRARESVDGKMVKPKGPATKVSVNLGDLIKGMTAKAGGEAAPAPKPAGGGLRRV